MTLKEKPGTEPSVSNTNRQILTDRLNVGGSYYVRGHLLNHNNHGAGNTRRNLSSITKKANAIQNDTTADEIQKDFLARIRRAVAVHLRPTFAHALIKSRIVARVFGSDIW